MAYDSSRMSTLSSTSGVTGRAANPSAQVSTQTLLNALHTSYSSSQPHTLESSTSLTVNTWWTAFNLGPDGRLGGTADLVLARRAWEHARRRAEDGCIVLGSLHHGSPSMIASFVSSIPIQAPNSLYTALEVVKAFTHTVTPFNPSLPRYSALSAQFNLNLLGEIIGASLALSKSGINTQDGLLHIPSEAGFRAFDVFYYLNVTSASQAERDFLNLRPLSAYALTKRSGTYDPPSYVHTADDAAAAEDFRANLKAIGIKGAAQRGLISALAGILKLGDTLDYMIDEEVLQEICEDVAPLLDMDKDILLNKLDTRERETFIAGLYEALVDWVIQRANDSIRQEIQASRALASEADHSGLDDIDSVNITVLELPGEALGKAAAFRTVFDDTEGINMEMREDGVPMLPVGSSVLTEMRAAVQAAEAHLGSTTGALGREAEQQRDRREGVLEKVAQACGESSYLRQILHPVPGQGVVLGNVGRLDLNSTLSSSRLWFQLNILPTDDSPANLANGGSNWSASAVSRQLRAWRLPEWANHRNRSLDFTADFDFDEFATRYARLGCRDGRDGVEAWLLERGWCNGEVIVGTERVWIREAAWWEAESMLDVVQPVNEMSQDVFAGPTPMDTAYSVNGPNESGFFGMPSGDALTLQDSRDDLLARHPSTYTAAKSIMGAQSLAPTQAMTTRNISGGGDYGLGRKGDNYKADITYEGQLDAELGEGKVVVAEKVEFSRRVWVAVVWALTFWIPSPALHHLGRMKRPDIRMAWREKLVLVMIIFLINATIVFYIIAFGRLLCPNFDKAWNTKEVGYHQGNDDFYVSHHGKVYDLSKFWKTQHSDTNIETTTDLMQPFGGTNVDEYIRPPLTLACPKLVSDPSLSLIANNTPSNSAALHISGTTLQPDTGTALHSDTWYTDKFLPKMNTMYKGDLVWAKSDVKDQGQNQQRNWVIISDSVYDLTDYFNTLSVFKGVANYKFFSSDFTDLVQGNAGLDITTEFAQFGNLTSRPATLQCLNNYFYVGKTDFRQTAKCQVNNYILLAFTIILCAVILVKFLAALQLGSKRRPAPQDKFVICQVPAYTEGEDQIRKSLDSLTALAYDNKRKLICVICDGMIVGGGNDRPTPKIVLDVLGVDPKTDPPALPFRSVGMGSEQLNYGKVYSGLYEYEGNVVPYVVIVKVGKESEQRKSKPGNRGKRDSQILLMSFLNRVHHRSPMSPLELEMFHQINNVIGVDPELYEYLFMVDADTMVKEDSLNRLVAACANDAKIAGICGETSLENEEHSWWTMIQVYEYFISHHLAKAFESLFASVTCLPGCFCMYRLRTADKGKPLIISDKVIDEYSDGNVDTLHKKNLLSLGEDRYLTTLMTKHFPAMSYKFLPHAHALTAAPDSFSVLLSQRRRWINSTIHNLAELVWLKDMCGFCCFSMRFVVFIDLFGTIILPATCAYLAYLIYTAATGQGQFPIVSIIMLAAVYGLQAIIFIIKRQWQHIGWMIIYILAFPIYSLLLPVYSFWKQDDFSWGNTRIVIGEKGDKQMVAVEDEGYDPRSIPLQRWDDYATANALPGRRGYVSEKSDFGGEGMGYQDGTYEMDDMHSTYSSVKPASAFMPSHMSAMNPAYTARQSVYSQGMGMSGAASAIYSAHPMSHAPLSTAGYDLQNPFSSQQNLPAQSQAPNYNRQSVSSENLMANPQFASPGPYGNYNASTANLGVHPASRGRSPLVSGGSRPVSTINFMDGPKQGPSDAEIVAAIRECLKEIDLDHVTKKQLKALAEQRLQCQLVGERKQFLDGMIDVELASM